ncbi:MAG TPA: BlaI/MecI/CopY family transcriptional regulator [Candidatus Baltobacteraceae bacterium]|nr:BlaI/MecI/CopY family transcriptional regulator [Candidatus Baltobacteraceae bacterium]
MPRKRSVPLTEAEQRLMEVLWRLRSATLGQVVDALPEPGRPAANTVQTTLKILESKGYVRHTAQGRSFLYAPVVDRQAAARTALSYVTARFFGGSPAQVALNLLDDESITAEQLDALRKRIDEAKRGAQ